MISKKQLSRDQALQKVRHYCAYQERCHKEVKEKLYSFGLWKKDVDEVLAVLIEEDYLNEERFAVQYAGGHFRLKSWGKIRIRYELKQKLVSEYCIKKALSLIPEEDYLRSVEKLASYKWEACREETNNFARKRKVQDYLLRKGYEPDLFVQIVNGLLK